MGLTHNLSNASFVVFDDYFARLIGSDPYAEILVRREEEFAHEGPVYLPQSNEVSLQHSQSCSPSAADMRLFMYLEEVRFLD